METDKPRYNIQMQRVLIFILILLNGNSLFASDWQNSIGLIQITVPKFQGANSYRWLVVPNVDVKYKKWFFANAYQGVGVNVLNSKRFTLGTSVLYNFGGKDERAEQFPGLKDNNDQILAGAFFSYKLGLLSFSLKTYRALGTLKDSGYYSPSLGLFIPFWHPFLLLTGVSAQFSDRRYLQGIFGVTTSEAAASGLPAYQVHAGWQSISLTVMPIWVITSQWNVSGVFSVKRFLNQAANSPLILHKTTFFSGLALMYKFGS